MGTTGLACRADNSTHRSALSVGKRRSTERDQVLHILLAHVVEGHCGAGRVLGVGGHHGSLARRPRSEIFAPVGVDGRLYVSTLTYSPAGALTAGARSRALTAAARSRALTDAAGSRGLTAAARSRALTDAARSRGLTAAAKSRALTDAARSRGLIGALSRCCSYLREDQHGR